MSPKSAWSIFFDEAVWSSVELRLPLTLDFLKNSAFLFANIATHDSMV